MSPICILENAYLSSVHQRFIECQNTHPWSPTNELALNIIGISTTWMSLEVQLKSMKTWHSRTSGFHFMRSLQTHFESLQTIFMSIKWQPWGVQPRWKHGLGYFWSTAWTLVSGKHLPKRGTQFSLHRQIPQSQKAYKLCLVTKGIMGVWWFGGIHYHLLNTCEGLHSTEVAFLLPSQQPRVQILAQIKHFRLRFVLYCLVREQ